VYLLKLKSIKSISGIKSYLTLIKLQKHSERNFMVPKSIFKTEIQWRQGFLLSIKVQLPLCPGGGGLPFESDGDARRLA